MIRSMTGYGQAVRTASALRIQAEIKSVNHRYGEIVVRLPREWSRLEEAVKKEIGRLVKRGRIDAFITVERESPGETKVDIDWPLAEGYMQAAERIGERFGLTGQPALKDLMQLPNMFRFREQEADADAIAGELLATVHEAAGELLSMRETEGMHLESDLRERLRLLRQLEGEIRTLAPRTASEYRIKLRQRMEDLLGQTPIDESRIAAEVAFFAERSDITEELTRLESHFSQMETMLHAQEPVGRKLDFLVQEMNREANTIGSKASHAELSQLTVELKAELEKIREQVQNIE
jgi:uncharacterized protein (TIGR00255 family)